EFDEQRRDHLLRDRPAGTLANVDPLRRLRDEGEHAIADKRIMHHEIGGRQQTSSLHGEEVWVPWAGSDQCDAH
ncbi:MAG: hypothetical protein ACI8RE_003022, partial [Ilumatobacter sp.]